MSLIVWIEETALAEWVRYSIWGYPTMITLHSFGLATMVGMSTVLSLRVLGLFAQIPFPETDRFFRIAWAGFLINFLSGSGLFANSASRFIVDWLFLLKMSMVIAAAILVGVMQNMISVAPARPGVKVVAWLTIAAWAVAMIAGRFIAYPH